MPVVGPHAQRRRTSPPAQGVVGEHEHQGGHAEPCGGVVLRVSRCDQRGEGLSVRALAARHRVHRRTVRQALGDAVPPAPKAPVRVWPVLGPHAATVRGWLLADVDVPRKQRHTARRVWQRLVEEEGAQGWPSSKRVVLWSPR